MVDIFINWYLQRQAEFLNCNHLCFVLFQDELVGSLEQALKSQNIPEITQTLLNLAEFMEHCDIKVSITNIDHYAAFKTNSKNSERRLQIRVSNDLKMFSFCGNNTLTIHIVTISILFLVPRAHLHLILNYLANVPQNAELMRRRFITKKKNFLPRELLLKY